MALIPHTAALAPLPWKHSDQSYFTRKKNEMTKKEKEKAKERKKNKNKIKETKRDNLNVYLSSFSKAILYSARIRRCRWWSMIPFGHWFTKNIWYTTAMFKLRSRISDISGYMASNDFSINAENVERYFDRIENCQ